MEAMLNRILFCCNGHQGMVLRFVEIVTKPPRHMFNAGKQYVCNKIIKIIMNKNNKNKNFLLPIKVPQGANNLIQ
jgi:phosphoribosylformylglycinamidine (FGAM) synthase-like amidotransferase family enzyme